MPPEIVDFGGHAYFQQYADRFNQEYRTTPVLDVRGYEIIFADPKYNGEDDCAHVCYGGAGMKNRREENWKEDRARRILWIKSALQDKSHTTIHVSNEAKYPNQDSRVYLYYITDDANSAAGYEYFCVVAVVRDTTSLYFLTAYTLTQSEWRKKKETCRKEWPLTTTKKKKREKKNRV